MLEILLRIRIWTGVVLLIFLGCAHPQKSIHEAAPAVYVACEVEDALVGRWSPAFLTYNNSEPYNRIGRPSARFCKQGDEEIYIDHRKPGIYYMTYSFSTEKRTYTNLVYRVHFSKVPFSLIPLHLTSGKNVGIMVVITIDEDQRPLIVTTVGTCGCYVSIVPTSYLPDDAFPIGWTNKPLNVYGEKLPSVLEFGDLIELSILIHLRPGVHRVMDLELVERKKLSNPDLFTVIMAPLLPMESLKKIPINGQTTSFYYKKWPLKGHVKGSVKPWETMLLSLISFDFFVGTDKVFGDSNITGNRFYTSLKPWNRKASDMWEFASFLKYKGWRL